ncbi:uncharacterized protein K452DRAFT_284090 [Aplosporella prunicola CBS 121167]|uniref:Zn(2)-C6 fungal-type domain-containing protein n=1 Tax=Aplosporella prunicola CBS 121167 TaxID=1176127 RepID=A0A6A6BR65_9PEZI|nr:uncharacterized protein K452DRAFT_284090 [Aplosporella prunicola CBS 121167]KAF2145724.1 hypothetical protein K452DRAFT_284090 [Aplosporella prunicola CBS 121167]
MEPKRRTACDECRTRKLKCSGGQPRCERCERERIECVYSLQKQMGRPRKRRRDDPNLTPTDHSVEFGLLQSAFAAGGELDTDATALPSLNHQHAIDPLLDDSSLDAILGAHPLPDSGYSDSHVQCADPDDAPAFDLPSPFNPPCSCLSNMYLTLSSLQSQPSFTFPYSLPVIQRAMATAAAVLKCQQCPKGAASAIQNLHQLSSTLMTIVDCFHRILISIDEEANRVDALGITKPFHIADASAPPEMHTGTSDCPARFGMDLTGQEWRTMARRVLKTRFVGSASDSDDMSLQGIVTQFERRQNHWHEDPHICRLRAGTYGEQAAARMDSDPEQRICGKMVEHVRGSILGLGL